MRVDGEPVATEDLEPHLATAGRYVGIAGLDPDPWEADVVGGNQVWTRPEDNATAAGTHLYTWSSGEYVFLLIGVDDALNRALVEALPGEPAPSPTPVADGRRAPSELAVRRQPGGLSAASDRRVRRGAATMPRMFGKVAYALSIGGTIVAVGAAPAGGRPDTLPSASAPSPSWAWPTPSATRPSSSAWRPARASAAS